MKKIITCLFLIVLACQSMAEKVHHHEDQDRAREAVERGEVAAYSQLEDSIRRQFKGRIIRVELDKGWHEWLLHEWLYKLRLLEDDGRVIKIEVDAKNLQVLEVEGRKLEDIVIIP